MSDKRYFGTDGIRGTVGTAPISADFVLRLGRAAGRVLAPAEGDGSLLIGKDTRLSGYMFESALEAGLIAAGAGVQLLGPMPTPAVAHLTRASGASAGIVISASHNPHHDNGIKFFSARGEKLADAMELAIEAELERPFDTVAPERLGKAVRMVDAPQRYLDFVRASVPTQFSLRGVRLVVDCANGANYLLAPQLFAAMGADVVAMANVPDGLNINLQCGSMHPEAMAARVRETGADLGIAFDGDGDRLVLADGQGRVLDGDDLLFVLACDRQSEGQLRGPVVGTLMSNFGLERALRERGIGFLRARVGDRYVHQMLVEHGGVLGGEASGHLLMLDHAGTGDALLNAVQLLHVLVKRGQALEQLLAPMQRYPQRTINVKVARGARPAEHPGVLAARAEIERELGERGRVVLRASGTEPVVRVTIEADSEALVERLVNRLADAVRSAA